MIRPGVRRAALGLVALGLLVAPAVTRGAATQYWTLRSAADHQATELKGVALGADGSLAAGPAIEPLDLPGAPVAWAMLAEGDRTMLATGPGGRVLTVRGGDVKGDSTGDAQALSLTRGPDGALYVGTGPNGRVVRFDDKGRRTTFCETGEKYVWALAFMGRTLYAATGPRGRLFAIDAAGKSTPVLDARAAHLSALATDGHGTLFIGAAGRGIVYAWKDGRTRVLLEAPEKEIRALAWDGQALYAAALSAAPVTVDDAAIDPAAGEGQRSVVYRIVPDSSVATFWTAPQGLVYALAARSDGLYAATGSRAALYRIDARGRGEALWAGSEGQATALALPDGDERSGGALWLATSNPSRLLRVRPGAGEGSAVSPVLDAHRTARWGRLWADGAIAGAHFYTRSGNTASADSTWSDWRPLEGQGDRVASPAARCLQWKLAVDGGAKGRLRAVTVAWSELNQRPRIEDFVVFPVPGKFYEGELTVRRDPITQELPDGRRVQFSADAPRKGGSDALPPWATGLRPMSWKASDPNGDDLAFNLAVRREGETAWTPIAVGLPNPLYTWDTTGWPDGRYEVRLTATDEDENPPGQGLTDEAVATPVVLDRTPPAFATLDAHLGADGVILITGRAAAPLFFVARVDVGLDDQPAWYPAAADDGVWDDPSEGFTLRLSGVTNGDHLVRVRATDALGNSTVATRTVHVGR